MIDLRSIASQMGLMNRRLMLTSIEMILTSSSSVGKEVGSVGGSPAITQTFYEVSPRHDLSAFMLRCV